MYTTTYGLGEMIRDAIRKGCRRFLVGIGGSATNDGGIGMLQALGYGFYNKHGKPVPYGAAGLRELVSIDRCNVLPELEECSFYVACDVSNPLCGRRGSSVVYGPQKGAAPELIPLMDDWMGQYAALAGKLFPHADPDYPGVGAAGGVGFAFLTFTHAVLEPGIDIILRETGVKRYIEKADLVITGEGRLDGQTAMGKAPAGIAKLAKRYGKPVVAFAGGVTEDAGICNTCGIDAFFPIVRSAAALEEVMAPAVARKNMILAAEQVMRLWKAAADR